MCAPHFSRRFYANFSGSTGQWRIQTLKPPWPSQCLHLSNEPGELCQWLYSHNEAP